MLVPEGEPCATDLFGQGFGIPTGTVGDVCASSSYARAVASEDEYCSTVKDRGR